VSLAGPNLEDRVGRRDLRRCHNFVQDISVGQKILTKPFARDVLGTGWLERGGATHKEKKN
jgi:hypothetical protein